GGQKGLSVRVEIEPPGIAGALGKEIELPVRRTVAPHRGVEPDFADLGLRKNAMQSVESPVRPPLHRIERFVGILTAEATEEDLVFVTMPALLGILQEEEVRRRSEKDAAVPHLDPTGQVERRQVLALGPYCHLVGLAGAGGIF